MEPVKWIVGFQLLFDSFHEEKMEQGSQMPPGHLRDLHMDENVFDSNKIFSVRKATFWNYDFHFFQTPNSFHTSTIWWSITELHLFWHCIVLYFVLVSPENFKWHHLKKINSFNYIYVNLCIGPLKWIVCFQLVFHPVLRTKMKQVAQSPPGCFRHLHLDETIFVSNRNLSVRKAIFWKHGFFSFIFRQPKYFILKPSDESLVLCIYTGSVYGLFKGTE